MQAEKALQEYRSRSPAEANQQVTVHEEGADNFSRSKQPPRSNADSPNWNADYTRREGAMRQRYQDYDQVMHAAKDALVSTELGETIREIGQPADAVVYVLAKEPNLLKELNKLPVTGTGGSQARRAHSRVRNW